LGRDVNEELKTHEDEGSVAEESSSTRTHAAAEGAPSERDPAVEESESAPATEAESTPATESESAPATEAESTPATEAESAPATEAESTASSSDSTPGDGAEKPGDEAEKKDAGASKPKRDASKQRRKPRFPALMRAFRTRAEVEGTVEGVIKGGYEVKVGKARGFCPHSQIDLEREDDPESHVGKTHHFRIMQLRRGGEDLVLSRRVLLDERRAEEAKAVRATLIEGAVMQGHVAGTASFGAFVDLGAGVQGLVHISELSHKRVNRVEDAVKVGETVQVKILKVDEKSGRLSLSIRAAQDDPWSGIAEKFPVGSVHPGKIVRLADFGAFVEMAPGLEALAPASEFPPSPRGWKEALEVGSTRDWHVLSVNPKERRFSITLPGEGGEAPSVEVGGTFPGKVQRVENYGVFVWLAPGLVGLMPRAWTGTPPGTEMARRFTIGDSVEVTVVEIADGGRRIRLTRKGVEPEQQQPRPKQAPREDYKPPQDESQEAFGTSLADKLRAALGDRES
jgi:small subunit ribosomal protein S1